MEQENIQSLDHNGNNNQGKNGWTSFSDYALAEFAINFNGDKAKLNYEEVVDRILILTNKYEICQLGSDRETNAYISAEYLNYLKFNWNVLGNLRVFDLAGFKYFSTEFPFPFTRLAFYDEKGEIVEKSISEIGNKNYMASYVFADRSIGRTTFHHHNHHTEYLEIVSPVSFKMATLRKWVKDERWYLVGNINSDIWLDEVESLKINETEYDQKWAGKIDNRALAYRHTPRLNSFLRGLKQIAEDFDGEWHFGSEKRYLHDKWNIKRNTDENSEGIWTDHAIPLDGKIIYYEDMI